MKKMSFMLSLAATLLVSPMVSAEPVVVDLDVETGPDFDANQVSRLYYQQGSDMGTLFWGDITKLITNSLNLDIKNGENLRFTYEAKNSSQDMICGDLPLKTDERLLSYVKLHLSGTCEIVEKRYHP